MAGTGPQYVPCAQFGVPAIGLGVGNANSNNHAPNENIVIDDHIQGIKHAAWVFHRFGTRDRGQTHRRPQNGHAAERVAPTLAPAAS
jgi:hypothetical protein